MTRRGFTALEVLVSITIVALAFAPVLSMLGSGVRESFFSEYHFIAQTRAESILDLLTARGFHVLPDGPPGTASVLPETAYALPLLGTDDYRRRLAGFEESVTCTSLEEGLAELTVDIGWLMPDEQGGGNHHYRMRRLVSDPLRGLRAGYTPRQQPAR